MNEFKGKTVIITGAASGIGKAAAKHFGTAGAHIIFLDLDAKGGNESLEQLRNEEIDATFIEGDVRFAEDVQTLIRTTIEMHGSIDVLVNNAGINKMGPVEELSEEDWDLCMDVNGKGSFLCSKYAAVYMKKKRKGCIINLASVNSFEGKAYRGAFTYSKGGIITFTKTLAAELGPYGIRVNAVAPGAVLTKEFKEHISAGRVDVEKLKEITPLRTLLEPEDIAEAIAFLASERARYISGVTLPVDAGWLADGGRGYISVDVD